jgi:hypothetical protein
VGPEVHESRPGDDPVTETGQNGPFPEKNQEKPQKTCGNTGFPIDKRF